MEAYREKVTFAPIEIESWSAVLNLAWLDQAVWLLGNWPEGWANQKERQYLLDLATLDLNRSTIATAA